MAQMCADKRKRLHFFPIRVYLRHPRLNSFLWVAGAASAGPISEIRSQSSLLFCVSCDFFVAIQRGVAALRLFWLECEPTPWNTTATGWKRWKPALRR
jgi:hypothetical protein